MVGNILLFHGCMNRFYTSRISEATEKILTKAKVEYINLDNEECCGFILYENGQEKTAKGLMKKNQEIFSGLKEVDTILTSCPTCAYIFKKHYPKYLKNFDYNIIHVTELLARLIEEKKIDIPKKNISVTYHDPCHLLRGLQITEEPRNILNAVLEGNIMEMDHSREASKCCGAGSGVRLSFSRIAQTLARDRIAEAKKTDASVLVTSCPTCMLHLQENAKILKVIDIVEIINL
ncbi:MAG: (Fe-S)-binding protein [Candidatus Heimdallarchaeota archaeon]|nr:MAG: (Fe-S)-binding protein [Candidatus Heimdallarchaeota archaeon]